MKTDLLSRRDFHKAAIAASVLAIAAPAEAGKTSSSGTYPYAKPIGVYPQPEFIRDALRLHFGSAKTIKSNLFLGWDEEIVAYGMAPAPVGKQALMQFYGGVFAGFPDFRLVSDSLIVAGDMGAHRYHAMGTYTGGPEATGQQVMFRGQTIYRINPDGRVTFRFSNHDHGFREAQIAYSRDKSQDAAIRSFEPDPFLHQPGYAWIVPGDPNDLQEHVVRRAVQVLTATASQASMPESYWQLYRSDATIHGLVPGRPLDAQPLSALQERQSELRKAMPDLTYATDELVVCGPYAIQQSYAWGHHSGSPLDGHAARGNQVLLREQTIYRFDERCQVSERWINHDNAYLAAQLR
jgi:predicted ester cyclase